MKKLITWLVSRHNKRVKEENRIEVVSPVVFSAATTSKINTTLYKNGESQKFLQDMISEKKYDLRQELIRQIYLSEFIHEEVEIGEQEIFIKLQIKAFDYGKS